MGKELNEPSLHALADIGNVGENGTTVTFTQTLSEEHCTQFLFAELGTSGSVDGSRRLVIKGRFQQKQEVRGEISKNKWERSRTNLRFMRLQISAMLAKIANIADICKRMKRRFVLLLSHLFFEISPLTSCFK
jgi:hypothetical protein